MTASKTHDQEPRTSRTAITSFLVAATIFLISVFLVLAAVVCQKLVSLGYAEWLLTWLLGIMVPLGCSTFVLMSIGPLVSLRYAKNAFNEIGRSGGAIVGRGWAISGIVLSLLIWVGLLAAIIVPSIVGEVRTSRRMACGEHLSKLGRSLLRYAEHNGRYPPADKWCDVLVKGDYIAEAQLKCPGNKKAKCSYAMNPNCGPNSPPDVVLLFETKGGWNTFGGPELLTGRNHQGQGANILFNDGSVAFQKSDPNDRFHDEFNWGQKDPAAENPLEQPVDSNQPDPQ